MVLIFVDEKNYLNSIYWCILKNIDIYIEDDNIYYETKLKIKTLENDIENIVKDFSIKGINIMFDDKDYDLEIKFKDEEKKEYEGIRDYLTSSKREELVGVIKEGDEKKLRYFLFKNCLKNNNDSK